MVLHEFKNIYEWYNSALRDGEGVDVPVIIDVERRNHTS